VCHSSHDLDVAFALHIDRAQGAAVGAFGDMRPGAGREMDRRVAAERRQTRRHVDRVAPDVEAELAGAYHAGHHRADVDAAAQPPAGRRAAGCLGQGERGPQAGHDRIGMALEQIAGRHEGVADRLDLLQAVRTRDVLEGAGQVVN
jgi:hypothetical protein